MNTLRIIFLIFLFTNIFAFQVFAGYWGGALEFDGNEDFALIPSFATAPIGNSCYSQEMWIKVNDWRYYWNGSDWYNGFMLSRGSETAGGGNHICLIEQNVGLTHWGPDSDTGFSIDLNRWYHLSATWDGQKESLYINGNRKWSKDFGPLGQVGGTMTFGKHDNVPASYYFCGQIDEIKVWDYARSGSEIKNSYLVKIDPNTPGLVGYWQFDENDGQEIQDSTLHRNHGYLGGTNQIEPSDPKRVCSILPLDGDFDSSYLVDVNDIHIFTSHWLTVSCVYPDCCSLADLNNDGRVNLMDFAIMANNWMDSFTP